MHCSCMSDIFHFVASVISAQFLLPNTASFQSFVMCVESRYSKL